MPAKTSPKRHEVEVHEGAAPTDSPAEATLQKERHPYKVTSDAGLFKNGKEHRKGSKVMLDADTAQRFIDAGDVAPW